jgi:hypothetical protein
MAEIGSDVLKVVDSWFGAIIRRKLHGKEYQDVLVLKVAGNLVVPMRYLYSTFNQLTGRLRFLDTEWTIEKREDALEKISDFSYDWEAMPKVVGSLNAFKELQVNQKDVAAVQTLINCRKKFLENAGLDEEGIGNKYGPTPWGNSNIFQELLKKTKEARTDEKVREVKIAVEQALSIFDLNNITIAEGAWSKLKTSIVARFPTIPYPNF